MHIQRVQDRVLTFGFPGSIRVQTGGGGAVTYASRVLALSPIAYWPLYEASGTTAACLVNSAQNGTYNSDVSGWPPGTGIGDGNTAPFFDGTNDLVNIYSATLAGVFNGAEGSIHAWMKVANAGAWTDGSNRTITYPYADAANYIRIIKSSVDNTLYWRYEAGDVIETSVGTCSDTGWITNAITWSKTADEVRTYINGTPEDTLTTLGVWAGSLVSSHVAIGSTYGTILNSLWHGWIAHVGYWDRPLTPAEIADLAVV